MAVSGCVSEGGPTDAPPLNSAPPATFDEATGGISGTIVDDESQPISGAEVGIPALELSTVSDLAGVFTFSNLEPGTYNLYTLRLGYDSDARPVEVRAGQVTNVDVRLTPTAITGAYDVLLTQRGLFGCGASWTPGIPPEPAPGINAVPGTGGLPNRLGGVAGCGTFSDAEFEGTPIHDLDAFSLDWQLDEPTENWKTAVFEMRWTSNQLAGRGLDMAWETADCYNRGAFVFARAEGGSPVRAVADEERIQGVIANGTLTDLCADARANCNEDVCKILSRVFATEETTASDEADVGISFQQTYEMFLSAFYVEPAPEGWTALEEA